MQRGWLLPAIELAQKAGAVIWLKQHGYLVAEAQLPPAYLVQQSRLRLEQAALQGAK
jgi:hypothetical protein